MRGKGRAAAPKRSTFDHLDAGDVASLKDKLSQANGSLQDDVVDTLFSSAMCSNIYDKACKGKKDSPNCLCGFIPAPGGYRKKGLWQKDSKALLTQGPDPSTRKRNDPATPSGLNNLGNTCYVNSALQCLFNIPAFRVGLYALEPPVAEEPVVSHIRELFAAMQSSLKSSADPTAFANSLSLDNSVQQDGQEFFKLLLSHLERNLTKSGTKLRELVPSLFRGAYAYETTCQVCGRKSESSHRETHFYELDIQVKGVPTLEQSMEEMVQVEWLNGDNQYFCSFCQAKVDASRQLRLRRLPPFLCLSLQRFVFDMKKLMKVKASDKISFPLSLDLSPLVAPDTESPSGAEATRLGYQYELAAILVHKGPSATHGHYVAHIRDESSGKWWRFDDETVTAMPAGPLGEHGDHGVASEKKPSAEKKVSEKKATAGAKGGARNKRRKDLEVIMLSDDEAGDAQPAAAPKRAKAEAAQAQTDAGAANGSAHAGLVGSVEGGSAEEGRITSANAYMLMYRRTAAAVDDASTVEQITLPDGLQAGVQQANNDFSAQCSKFQEEKEAMVQQIKARQEYVRQVLESAPLQTASEECRFVSAEWLRAWVDADKDQAVDNTAVLCEHGKLHPDRISAAKRISMRAWEALSQRSGGGPELGKADVCKHCLSRRLQEQEDAEQSSERREAILALLDDEDAVYSEGYYVSKTWLMGWKKRQGKGVSSTSPTQGITCPHGDLQPQVGAKAKHAIVPTPVWDFISHSWERQRARERLAAEKKRKEEEAAAQTAIAASKAAEERVVVEEGWEPIPMELLSHNGDANGDAHTPEPVNGEDEPTIVAVDDQPGDEESTAPDAGEGSRVFPVASTSDCQQCLQDLQEGAAAGKGIREQLGEQRAAFPALAAGVAPQLESGAIYCLLPRPWLDTWRAYLASVPKRGQPGPQELLPPPPLDEAVSQMFCSCHLGPERLLDHAPPRVVKRRGRWVVDEPSNEMLELVDPNDYARLIHLYGRNGDAENPIPLDDDSAKPPGMVTATLEVIARSRSATPTPARPDAEPRASSPVGTGPVPMEAGAEIAPPGPNPEPQLGDDAETVKVAENGRDEGAEEAWWVVGREKRRKGRERPGGELGTLVCRPDWCRQAVQARADARMAAQLDYSAAEIAVELVSEGTLHDPANQRKSKRARKGRAVLTMASSQTLQQLKLMVAENLGVHPHNALIHSFSGNCWRALEGNERTLKELAVLPNTDLRVLSNGEKDDEDITSFIDSPSDFGRQAVERGFVGTALTG